MTKAIAFLFCFAVTVQGQNWAVFTWASRTNDPQVLQGMPTNWVAEWKNVGTNQAAPLPYTFIGNNAARAAWESARIGAYQTWQTSTWLPQDISAKSNVVFTTTNNIASFTNLLTSNFVFLATVQTNQAAVTTLVLSNQTVTLSRLINRIGKMLTDQYRGD